MKALLWLLPLSLCLVVLATGFLFWAIKSKQYQELERNALEILDDPSETEER